MNELDLSTYAALPDERKRQLCVELLAEFGVEDFAETAKGELRHRCTLPLGGHTDRNSVTASINYRKLLFHCLVCHSSGSVLWWAAVNRHETVANTGQWLKDKSGFTSGVPLGDLLAMIDALFHPRTEERVWPVYDERVLAPWLAWPMHHPYLTLPWVQGGREIPPDTLTRFRVGYCDEDPDWKYYQRIVIPLFWDGKLVGWQARRLWPQDPNPAKYLSSPDPPRDRVLFGDPAVFGADSVVLVESMMSVLRHAHHQPMLASMGADVTDLQLRLLHRFKRVYLALDNDPAGWRALAGTRNKRGRVVTAGLIERLRPYTEVFVVQHRYGAIADRPGAPDPSDFTEDEFAAQVRDAVPAVLWHPPDPTKLDTYNRQTGAAMPLRKYGSGEILDSRQEPVDDDERTDPPPPAEEPAQDPTGPVSTSTPTSTDDG